MTTYHGRVQVNGALNRGVLNLRKLPQKGSNSLAEMPDGTELDVTLSSDKDWFKTTYNGKTGYVEAMNIAITQNGLLHRVNVDNGTLNIRKKPETTADPIFTAAKGRGLYVLETSGNWCLVSCNIGTGWASKTYLVEDAQVEPFDYPTVNEFIERLKSFCGKGWKYGQGYSSTGKYIDCSNYPYVARFGLGAKGASTEYNAISSDEKGVITDRSMLKVGMEVFQSDRNNEASKKHMGVYAGLVSFSGSAPCHAVYQSRAVYNANQKAMYSEKTGPNLTEMNSDWDCWAWSKYVKH